LPVNVQSSQSVHVFKLRLKTFLFNCASNSVNRRDLIYINVILLLLLLLLLIIIQ